MSILPQNDFYCITAMLNKKDEILLWYIDMIADKGFDKDGILSVIRSVDVLIFLRYTPSKKSVLLWVERFITLSMIWRTY